VASAGPDERADTMRPLADALAKHVSISTLWRERWEHLAPRMDADTQAHLRQLLATIDRHAAALSAGSGTPGLRDQLTQRLDVLLRLSSGTVVATACYLGKLLLALERLRGGIASRCLLGPAILHPTVS
jgi:hypothetical protein